VTTKIWSFPERAAVLAGTSPTKPFLSMNFAANETIIPAASVRSLHAAGAQAASALEKRTARTVFPLISSCMERGSTFQTDAETPRGLRAVSLCRGPLAQRQAARPKPATG
jgi:hypothetical protein